MNTITIPRSLAKEELVIISKKELDALRVKAEQKVTETDVLAWSREAKKQRRARTLAKL